MTEFLPLIERFGYVALFGIGFLEFAGVPVVTVPVLIAAGSLAAAGVLEPGWVIVVTAAGGLLSDLGWYWTARRVGPRLTSLTCGLTSNPRGCVLNVTRQVERVGAPYILVGKFIPGVANLIAPASGLAGMGAARFIGLNSLALLAWAGLYAGLGYVAAEPTWVALEAVGAHAGFLVRVGLALVLAAGTWRWAKIRLHRRLHGAVGAGGEVLLEPSSVP